MSFFSFLLHPSCFQDISKHNKHASVFCVLNSKKQESQELLKQTFDLKMQARFQNSLEKVIWMLFQKIEKASEISSPDIQNQNETEAATGSYVPNSKNFVNF
jgi:hypothetical protein